MRPSPAEPDSSAFASARTRNSLPSSETRKRSQQTTVVRPERLRAILHASDRTNVHAACPPRMKIREREVADGPSAESAGLEFSEGSNGKSAASWQAICNDTRVNSPQPAIAAFRHQEGLALVSKGCVAEALRCFGEALAREETSERWNDWAAAAFSLGQRRGSRAWISSRAGTGIRPPAGCGESGTIADGTAEICGGTPAFCVRHRR